VPSTALSGFLPSSMSAEIESLVTDDAARRAGRGTSPLPVVLATIALLVAAYAQVRTGRLESDLELAQGQLAELQGTRVQLASQQAASTNQLQASLVTLRAELQALRELPAQVDELSRSQAELRARTDAPERAWVRAEALYLLELASRRLDLEGDVRTAIVAMEAADARLATLKDPALAGVRTQLGKELAALRAAPLPDLPAVLLRVGAVEARVAMLPVTGIPISEGRRAAATADEGPLEREWESRLADLEEVERQYATTRRERRVELSAAGRAQRCGSSTSLPVLRRSSSARWASAASPSGYVPPTTARSRPSATMASSSVIGPSSQRAGSRKQCASQKPTTADEWAIRLRRSTGVGWVRDAIP